jgi:TolB-like protein
MMAGMTRFLLLMACLVSFGCAADHKQRGALVSPDAKVDLSGYWNDVDANQVAKAMISDCLNRPWAQRFRVRHRRSPVIKLYPMRNRSSEPIRAKYFTKQVESELANSRVADVVAGWDESYKARESRGKTRDRREIPADYLLNGWIVSQHDRVGTLEVRAYLVTMELTHIHTQMKVWQNVHRIKKVVDRAKQNDGTKPNGS